jgi:hypothetical protein
MLAAEKLRRSVLRLLSAVLGQNFAEDGVHIVMPPSEPRGKLAARFRLHPGRNRARNTQGGLAPCKAALPAETDTGHIRKASNVRSGPMIQEA